MMANTNVVFKKCGRCGKMTKGIWIRSGKMMCYICYMKNLTKMPNLWKKVSNYIFYIF